MFKVLKSKKMIRQSRAELTRLGCSVIENKLRRHARRFGIGIGLPIGDIVKSWDVLESIKFIDLNSKKEDYILDLGSYCSELPVSLAKMGFTNVHAVDLNPEVMCMPKLGTIKYTVSDFMATPFEQGSFKVITSISVIEHGYDPHRLFSEVARLLSNGGHFLASFDYWPEKIDTSGIKFFDMDWLIFSNLDLKKMLAIAASYGLTPVGEIQNKAEEAAIHCLNYDYTFGWLVLRKVS